MARAPPLPPLTGLTTAPRARQRTTHAPGPEPPRPRPAPHLGHGGLYGPRRLYAVHDRHKQVHKDDIGPHLANEAQRLLPAPGLADPPALGGRGAADSL